MRSCNCTGHLTNPSGVCCLDLPRSPAITTSSTTVLPLTEERIRQIIREELANARRS